MGDPWFWNALRNTGEYALIALPSALMVSLGLAILLNRPIRGQAIYRTIVFLPFTTVRRCRDAPSRNRVRSSTETSACAGDAARIRATVSA